MFAPEKTPKSGVISFALNTLRNIDGGEGTMPETETETNTSTRHLTLPPGPFEAYLFDCDGTIADSMPLQYIAWVKALGEWGAVFPEELFYSWGGMPAAEAIARLSRQQNIPMPVDEVAHRKEALYFELLPQLQPVPEVLE